MGKKKERYKIIVDSTDGSFAEERMNVLAEEGYRLVGMSTAGAYPVLYTTIIMEKGD